MSDLQEMRAWQLDAAQTYLESTEQHFLARVTPGGGKTYWALRMALADLRRGVAERLVVVVPSIPIKRQWISEAMAHTGIKLVDFSNLEPGGRGLITTYQQVATQDGSQVFRDYCEENRCLVIFDEVHHASDKRTWGQQIRYAFEGAARILSLTGTPFRSDGHAVPFVRYVDDVCQPDYSYVYPQALADDIVRSLRFVFFDGTASWRRGQGDARERVLSEASLKDLSAALAAAQDPEGGFARAMLANAHSELLEMPEGSAGLLVARDTEHADRLAELLHEVTGVKPIVAHNKTEAALKRIAKFRESSDRWIVSVRMISEGVDIPRIRVICWMTNYSTQLYFEQLIARGLRGTSAEQCVVVLPEIPDLLRMSLAVTESVIPGIAKDKPEAVGQQGNRGPRDGIEFVASFGSVSKTFTTADIVVESESIIKLSDANQDKVRDKQKRRNQKKKEKKYLKATQGEKITEEFPERLTIAEAVFLSGITDKTLRLNLQKGSLTGRCETTDYGFMWIIDGKSLVELCSKVRKGRKFGQRQAGKCARQVLTSR